MKIAKINDIESVCEERVSIGGVCEWGANGDSAGWRATETVLGGGRRKSWAERGERAGRREEGELGGERRECRC